MFRTLTTASTFAVIALALSLPTAAQQSTRGGVVLTQQGCWSQGNCKARCDQTWKRNGSLIFVQACGSWRPVRMTGVSSQ